jgi:hypothetical protein
MVGLRNRLLLGASSGEDDIVILVAAFCTANAFMANLRIKFELEIQAGIQVGGQFSTASIARLLEVCPTLA